MAMIRVRAVQVAFSAALMLGGLAFSNPAHAGACPAPPSGSFGSAWWSAYKAWCRNCGGTICDIYNNCGGRCNLPSQTTPSVGTMSDSAAERLGATLGNIVGDLALCAIFGQGCPQTDRASNEQARIDAASAASSYGSVIATAREDEVRRQNEVRQRVENVLSGAGSGALRMRDLDADDLQAAVVAGPMRTTQVIPAGIFQRSSSAVDTSRLPPMRRIRCAQALLHQVADRSADITSAQRSFYSEQAGRYLTASPAMVSCPADNQLPNLPTPPSSSSPPKEWLLQSKLFTWVFALQAEQEDIGQNIRRAKEARTIAAQKIEQATRNVALVRTSPTTDTAAQKQSAMEDAIRALNEAKQAQAAQDRLIAEYEGKATKLGQQLQETKSLYEEATRDPGRMDAILTELDRPLPNR